MNVTNITYVNRGVPGAVTATTSQAFTHAEPVARNIVRFDPHAAARVQVFAPAAVPTRQAVLGSGRVGVARPALGDANARRGRSKHHRHRPPWRLTAGNKPYSRMAAGRCRRGSAADSTQCRASGRAGADRAARDHRIAHPHAEHETPRAEAPPVARPADRPAVDEHCAGAATPAARRALPAAAVHPNEAPPTFKPPSPSGANSALERQHLQEQQQLRAQQDEDRQRVQQQQDLEHQQLARQQADKARKQQLGQQQEQQHQQQTQAMLQKHTQEQEQLQRQQQQQRQQQEAQTKPAVRKEDRPPNANQ